MSDCDYYAQAGTLHSPEGENRQTLKIALPSTESTFGFQQSLVKPRKHFGRRKPLTSKNRTHRQLHHPSSKNQEAQIPWSGTGLYTV